MTVSRPARLAAGDELVYRGGTYTVTAVAGSSVAVSDAAGSPGVVALVDLFADPAVTVVPSARRKAPLPSRGVLEGLPVDIADRAEW